VRLLEPLVLRFDEGPFNRDLTKASEILMNAMAELG